MLGKNYELLLVALFSLDDAAIFRDCIRVIRLFSGDLLILSSTGFRLCNRSIRMTEYYYTRSNGRKYHRICIPLSSACTFFWISPTVILSFFSAHFQYQLRIMNSTHKLHGTETVYSTVTQLISNCKCYTC